jgi:hypothetical protein
MRRADKKVSVSAWLGEEVMRRLVFPHLYLAF